MNITSVNCAVLVDNEVIEHFEYDYEARACAEQLKMLPEEQVIEIVKVLKGE